MAPWNGPNQEKCRSIKVTFQWSTECRIGDDGAYRHGQNIVAKMVANTYILVVLYILHLALKILVVLYRNYMKRNKQDKDTSRRHVRALTPQRSHHHHRHESLDNFATGST